MSNHQLINKPNNAADVSPKTAVFSFKEMSILNISNFVLITDRKKTPIKLTTIPKKAMRVIVSFRIMILNNIV